MKSLNIPVVSVGHGLLVTFGKRKEDTKGQHFFETVESPWLLPFLEEHALAGARAKELVQGSVLLTGEGKIIRAQAHFTFTPELECVRSLTKFRSIIETTMTGFFVEKSLDNTSHHSPSHHVLAGAGGGKSKSDAEADIELTDTDLDTYFFTKQTLALDEFILDALQLALPDLPLCTIDCKGLCLACGGNLNSLTKCFKQEPGQISGQKWDCLHFAELVH